MAPIELAKNSDLLRGYIAGIRRRKKMAEAEKHGCQALYNSKILQQPSGSTMICVYANSTSLASFQPHPTDIFAFP